MMCHSTQREPRKPQCKLLVLPMSVVTCDAQRDRIRLPGMWLNAGRFKLFFLACR